MAEWLANGRRPTKHKVEAPAVDSLAIDELILRYLEFARFHYRRNEAPTKELCHIKETLRLLHRLYGSTPAVSFGPERLKTVRERMISDDWSRGVVNQRVGRMIRAFKWAGRKSWYQAPTGRP